MPIPAVVLIFVVLIAYAILIRFYLLFPATAIEQPLKFGDAWRRMRGNTWRLIGAIFSVTLIVVLTMQLGDIVSIIMGLRELMTETLSARAEAIMSRVVPFLIGAIQITVLSNTYLHIMGPPGQETTTAS